MLGYGVLLLVASACTDRGLFAPPTLEPLLVKVDEHWFRDAKRRIVLLRGANLSVLERPREEGAAHTPNPGPTPRDEDFVWLEGLGFNLIRLPVPWASIESRPGAYESGFVRDGIDPLVRLASHHGMQVILALYQLHWSACIAGGIGAPLWACDGTAPSTQSFGDSGSLADLRATRAQCSFFRDGRAPGGRLLREHYTNLWRLIARYYKEDTRIAGFDLLNEPNAGICFPVERFASDVLAPFYDDLRLAVRGTGAPQAIVYQPVVTRSSPLAATADALGPGAVFSPHLFTQTYGVPEATASDEVPLDADYDRAQQLAQVVGGPLLIGEIGASAPGDQMFRSTTSQFLAASFDELDRLLIGGAVWAFAAPPADPPSGGVIKIGDEQAAAVLARPFARRIAGIPEAMHYDTDSRVFSFTFRDDPEHAPSDPTEIFLPAKRAYRDGYVVEVSRGDRWTFDEHTQRLLVYRGSGNLHTVRIMPAKVTSR